jgi:hypothetical protein
MQRRSLLKIIGTASLLAAPVLSQAAKTAAPLPAYQPIDPARWSAANRRALDQLMQTLGHTAKRHDAKRKPYAVFDWDNSCIMNDCEEALLMYQIDKLAFNLSPDEFATVVRQDVPNGPFKAEFKNNAGNPVNAEDIAADVEADYRWLYENFKSFTGSQTLEQVQQSEQFKDFRAKMRFMYDAICDSFPIEVGYKWIIYLFKNKTSTELQALAEASNDFNLGDALRKTKYISSEKLPGRAGVLTASHFHGLRIHTEMASLMDSLRANGFDVYVSTASLDDVVRVFTGLPKYGYNVPAENVIGLRLEMNGDRYGGEYRKNWHFNWGPGKTIGIQKELVARKGYGPALVLGDSDGDAWMLKDFVDTRLGVIVNRLKKGEIGERSKSAATQLGQANPRFILQGRSEGTGIFIPDEKTLKYGKSDLQLLA